MSDESIDEDRSHFEHIKLDSSTKCEASESKTMCTKRRLWDSMFEEDGRS